MSALENFDNVPGGFRPYSELVAAEDLTQTIGRMKVVICPETHCTRTATIETNEAGEEIVRFHRRGKLYPITATLLSEGRAEAARCPHHELDERQAARRLRQMAVERGLEDDRSAAEILDELLLRDFTTTVKE